MFRLAAILVLLLTLGFSATVSWGSDDEPAADSAQRVIVRVQRDEVHAGVVELENDQLIIIRDLEGEVHSFAKGRVAQIVFLVEPKDGQVGTVHLLDGSKRHGIVLEDGYEHVRIDEHGIRSKLPREMVDHVVLEPTFAERYAQIKASIEPHMTQRWLALCQWLVDRDRYDLAKTELLSLIEVEPLPAATHLLKLVDAQLALDAASPPSERVEGVMPPERDAGPVDLRDMLPTEIVSRDDVNIVRVYEIDINDPPKVAIDPDTIRTLIETYGSQPELPSSAEDRNRLFNAHPIRVAELMFRVRARELYPRIQVLTEPRALNIFRQNVHNTWLMNSCATSRCHGGVDAGRFFLHLDNYRNERVRTTNFLILERLELDPEWPLIDYDEPLRSLIIQHGLPRDRARRPHPDVPGWRPVFTPSTNALLEGTIEWLEAMMSPRPDYPVEYEPPTIGGPPADAAPEGDDGVRIPR